MKTHLWYEPGVPQSHLDATEFAAEAFAGIRNEYHFYRAASMIAAGLKMLLRPLTVN